MGNPALDYLRPTITGPNSINERFLEHSEEQTGGNILEFPEPAYAYIRKRYALWRFRVKNTPLSAVVTCQSGRWFAELDWLNLFGEGESPSDAISNLSDHIEHYVEFYSEARFDQLTADAIGIRDRFMSIDQKQ